jgi:2-phospho-L-lactate transferase/gluconeogenesis factor (CofD/UPF0052 family)
MENGEKSNLSSLVFLSGGTALHQVSSYIGYVNVLSTLHPHDVSDGYHVTYIITCFDSGGSSAILRNCLPSYPAIGDIRNRICSVAQGMLDAYQEIQQSPLPVSVPCAVISHQSISLVHLCKHRLPNEKECSEMKLTSDDLHLVLSSFTKQLLSSDLLESQTLAPSASTSQNILSQLIQFTDSVPKDLCQSCGHLLQLFLDELTSNSLKFCFYNASLGNLILTGAYLEHNCDLRAAIHAFTSLLGICHDHEPFPSSRIIAASTDHLTLGAQLRSGQFIFGQHAITGEKGKSQTGTSNSPIQSIFLIDYQPHIFSSVSSLPLPVPPAAPAAAHADNIERFATATPEAMSSLESAGVICYSIGSFFTSLLASVLPTGISTAIRHNRRANKVFIPNMRLDSEMIGLSLFDATDILLRTLFKYDLLSPLPAAPATASVPGPLGPIASGASSEANEVSCESPPRSFSPANYLSVILLDRHSLSLLSSSLSLNGEPSERPPPYAHFGSSQEIAESIDRIQAELGIAVRVEDICRLSGDGMQTLEIDPEKLLKILRDL